jgi:erythronate-4-phosphate dehydrogenase
VNIVADQHIPFIQDIFSGLGNLHLVPGHDIGPEVVKKADILIVRSITRVDRALLEGSSVRYVGSATAGLDHVDADYLREAGIRLGSAPGANAESVVEYVFAALAEFAYRSGESFLDRRIGIVGAGNVGGLLAARCKALGMEVWINDPPLEAETGGNDVVFPSEFVSLSELVRHSEIISIHTPLTTTGPYPTSGLIDARLMAQIEPGTWFVHTARGGVCQERALVQAREGGPISQLALDVWEGEPTPNLNHIRSADLATGHIAGYSVDAKLAGLRMLKKDISTLFDLEPKPVRIQLEHSPTEVTCSEDTTLPELIRSFYPIIKDDSRFRTKMAQAVDYAAAFHAYRATYPIRRRFAEVPLMGNVREEWKRGLGLV